MSITHQAMSDTENELGASMKEDDRNSLNIEELAEAEAHLRNTTIHNITWSGVSVSVRDRTTKQPKLILENVEGKASAGELIALMGPSGSGKTTLLNVLARRPTGAESVDGAVLINGTKISTQDFREATCFVEQEDALIGSLTVRETLNFASRLSSGNLQAKDRIIRINGLLKAFGLLRQENTLIGTPIRKGISGGQKRRVGIASQLITSPKILFLDEPTSGLDSQASYEVCSYLRGIAKRNRLIVIASIHQPSTSTWNLFDQVLLLSGGRPHYFGAVAEVEEHYEQMGIDVPLHSNPAEFLLDMVNIDFARHHESASQRLDGLQKKWAESPRAKHLTNTIQEMESRGKGQKLEIEHMERRASMPSRMVSLIHRAFIKSYRDIIAYGIRAAMYLGLAIMMGTVWLRLDAHQSSIIPITNALFFGGAFLSFMAVATCPSMIEDRATYIKERHNGLYGPLEFVISNFIVSTPYLFLIALVFSAITYWLGNFQPTAEAFMTYVMWLSLDLFAAEGLVFLVCSIFPSFVISLAIVAFANGLWMSCMGSLQPSLNSFYKYAFKSWDYQAYCFEGLLVNEFKNRVYDCDVTPTGCHCMYQSALESECKIDGMAVVQSYGYNPDNFGRNIGLLVAIIAGYRVVAWLVLVIKKN